MGFYFAAGFSLASATHTLLFTLKTHKRDMKRLREGVMDNIKELREI
jgi:hypothetical protein